MKILCLDIGGTSTRAAIVNNGKINNKISKITPYSNKDEMLSQSISILKELINNNNIHAMSFVLLVLFWTQ